MVCPTVKVQSGDSFAIINESDFDPKVHKKFAEPAVPPPPPPGNVPPPPPVVADPLKDLPNNWPQMDISKLKGVAAAVSGRTVENKQQAIQVIEAALKARNAS